MSKLKKHCHECGAEYETVKHDARFCGTKCRKSYNNRRAVRGAELYDLFMASRYDREWADQHKNPFQDGSNGLPVEPAGPAARVQELATSSSLVA